MESSRQMPDTDRAEQQLLQVLVVDDDESVLDVLEQALSERPGQQIVACRSFEEARRRLREQPFDVLLTDVRLGAFNGLQLAVLAKDVNPQTRVIVFSGFDDVVLRDEAEHLGATYIVKPVQAGVLQALISGVATH
jgi:DNA-binding NtrC family response regulator